MDLYNERREYDKTHLTEKELTQTPAPLFEKWFSEAEAQQIDCPNAMSLSTVDTNGQPFQRIVLLKSFDENTLTFFTNYESKKAQQIAHNQQVSLLFFWSTLERQIHFTGLAEKTSETENAAYFSSRPRESQLAALASHQSSPIASRDALLQKVEQLNKQHPNDIPAPTFWGGYKVTFDSVEFWQGGSHRLHDRFLYTKEGDKWGVNRLSP